MNRMGKAVSLSLEIAIRWLRLTARAVLLGFGRQKGALSLRELSKRHCGDGENREDGAIPSRSRRCNQGRRLSLPLHNELNQRLRGKARRRTIWKPEDLPFCGFAIGLRAKDRLAAESAALSFAHSAAELFSRR